jgi:hypothetical protein
VSFSGVPNAASLQSVAWGGKVVSRQDGISLYRPWAEGWILAVLRSYSWRSLSQGIGEERQHRVKACGLAVTL